MLECNVFLVFLLFFVVIFVGQGIQFFIFLDVKVCSVQYNGIIYFIYVMYVITYFYFVYC